MQIDPFSVKIDKNIKLRADNQKAIVDFINAQNECDNNGDGSDALAVSAALGAIFLSLV